MIKKELQEWLNTFNNVTIPTLIAAGFKPTPVNAREGLANLTAGLGIKGPTLSTYDDIINAPKYNVPVRIYHPNPTQSLPVIVYYHGGGHMGGSVTVYDNICRKFAVETQHIVISVEYRLSPENPYPAGITDCFNVIKYGWTVLDNRNLNYKKELTIMGDSGGGACAATVAVMAQQELDISLKNMVLIYPSLDYTLSTSSVVENGKGYLLETSKIRWYFDNYFQNNEDRKEASPIFANINPKKFPKTFIITAQYCPLRDEGKQFYDKLINSGCPAKYWNVDNMIHTFMNMDSLCSDEVSKVYQKINTFLKD